MRVQIPVPVKPGGQQRKPVFVSPATQGIAITAYPSGTTPPSQPQLAVDVSASSQACALNADSSRTCNFILSAPVGSDDIRLDLYDATPVNNVPNGNIVGSGTAYGQAISSASINVVSIALGGVVAKMSIQPSAINTVADGNIHQFNVGVNFLDADSNVIVGSDALASPVSLAISNDPNSTLSISTSQISSPANALFSVSYDGGSLSNGVITANAAANVTATTVIAPLNYSPSALSFLSPTPQTISVSQAGYSGTYQATASTCAAVSPQSAAPASAGGSVTFTITPLANGSCTISIVGSIQIAVPVNVQMTQGQATIPSAVPWIIEPRSEQIVVQEANFSGTFGASVNGSCLSVSPSSAHASNNQAIFTVTGVSEGSCTLTVTGKLPHTFTYNVKSDDFLTFAHDDLRSGVETKSTAISKTNIYQLTPRWKYWAAAGIHSAPIVANGFVYLETNHGDVRGLDAKTGNVVWSVEPFGANANIAMTPAVHNGLLYVGQHDPEGSVRFDALNGQTGAVVWSATLSGAIRSEPTFANGAVIVGTAGGDVPLCNQGGVYAFDQNTGTMLWHWLVDQTPQDGGSVWSPITFDGTHIIFGTGNTCSSNAALDLFANSVVALNPADGSVAWVAAIDEPQTNDNDIGGGVMEFNGRLYVTSKNGNYYVLDAASGAILSHSQIGLAGFGGIGTPSTDGSTVIVSQGYRSTNGPGSYGDGGLVCGFDLSGNQKWVIGTADWPVQTSVTINNGLGFLGLDNEISAIDVSNGTVLWSSPLANSTDRLYAAIAVTESGVYAASEQGYVYAFGIGDTALPLGNQNF